VGECDLGFLISDFGLGTLLRSVSVNLAELRMVPATGGWGVPAFAGRAYARIWDVEFLISNFEDGDPTTLSLGKPR
jgi:hypothetical protein